MFLEDYKTCQHLMRHRRVAGPFFGRRTSSPGYARLKGSQ